MNITEIFNKVVSQVSRLTGKTFSENLSEAEILAEIENMPSLAEQSATFQTGLDELSKQFGEFKTKFDEFKLPETISVDQMNSAIDTAIKAAVTPLQTGFATEINKLTQLAEASKTPAGKPEDVTIEKAVEKTEPVQKNIKMFNMNATVKN
jgi:hypothetical protein